MTSLPRVELVEVDEDEFESLFAMFETYCDEIEPLDVLLGERPSSEERRESLLDGAEEESWFWIEVGGERAGFLMAQTYEDDPRPGEQATEILECYVVPERRRRGIAAAAVEALLQNERGRGTALVEAGILHGNEGAQAFWRAMGFDTRSVQVARRP